MGMSEVKNEMVTAADRKDVLGCYNPLVLTHLLGVPCHRSHQITDVLHRQICFNVRPLHVPPPAPLPHLQITIP